MSAVAAPRRDAFAAALQRAVGGASAGVAEAAAAYARGERNTTSLTNFLFYARHPERRGRPIARDETQLAQEWLRLRDAVVTPALRQAASAPAPVVVAPPASPFVLPPDPAHLRPPARTNIAAMPLFPGDKAIDAEVQLIGDVAARRDGWLYLANWYAGVSLVPPKLMPVATALMQCAAAGATIRALFWDGTMHELDPVIARATTPLAALGPAVHDLVERYIKQKVIERTNHGVNSATARFIDSLGGNARRALDDATLPVGSHHQKLFVAGNSERTVAIIGGVDLNENRVVPTSDPGTPYFDVALQIDGQAAEDVADLFERRWRAHPSRAGIELAKRRRPTAPPRANGATVQIGPNFGCGQPLADITYPVRGGSPLIKNVLSQCRSFFYAEDQYGVGNNELAGAIIRAFANGAAYGIVVLANSSIVSDLPDIRWYRHRFWTRFPQLNDRLLVFERLGDDGTRNGAHAYVHSKFTLVDDRAATIASINMNRRSWYYDSEFASLLTDAPELIKGLRLGVWRQHLGLASEEQIRDPTAALSVWKAVHARGSRRLAAARFDSVPPRKADELVGSVERAVDSPLVAGLGGLVGIGAGLALNHGAGDALRKAINSAVDLAFDLVFDPVSPASCPR
jgi:phosphatidylserine/phosphatidylglycerophosphate/cardiolipin synthase-like enzyme